MITRFMQVMFSAAENNDEELTKQVADDIETTKAQEPGDGVEDDEVSYVNLGSGKVLVLDKENGEATVAEQNEDDPEQYDLEGFECDEDLEKYLHTLDDGVTPDENVRTAVTEDFEDHMTGEDVISPNLEDGGLNPHYGKEITVLERYCPEDECEDDDDEDEDEDEDEEKTYSLTLTEDELCMFSDYCDALAENMNQAILKLYSNEDLYVRIFSDVLEEDKPAIHGDLKIEKEDDDTLIVTDLESGDEAQITLNDDDEFVVSDVQKELSDDEKTYSLTLTEDELSDFCRLFSDDEEDEDEDEEEDEDDEDYDEDDEDVDEDDEDEDDDDEEDEDDDEEDDEDEDEEDEDEEKTYSLTMTEDDLLDFCRFFSDTEDEDEDFPNQYEPVFVVGIDPVNHLIVDSPVYGTEDADTLSQRLSEDGVENIQVFEDPDDARDYAIDLLGEAGVSEIEQIAEPKEHNFSDVTIYTTRYFSDCTEFMFKLFSEAEEEITETQDDIEDAIKNSEQTENDTEVITPVDDETAVVYDKESDEYTKVTLDDDEINTQKISEEEADELTKDLEFGEKKYSVLDRFFTEIEEVSEEQAPGSVDPSKINPETGDPVEIEPSAAPAQSVELVEDKALAAVQSIQEAANEAVLAITEAKDAPAPGEEQDLKEAQFSERIYDADTLSDWFESI